LKTPTSIGTVKANKVTPIPIKLMEGEVRKLNAKYPCGKVSAGIGKRAVELVRLYLRKRYPGCRFRENPKKGVDLAIDSPKMLIEIKGTEDKDISWGKLKVSGKTSYLNLTEKRVRIYRVTDVYGRVPQIHELVYGKHFKLTCEPRWRFVRL